jgi:hypothetical protein
VPADCQQVISVPTEKGEPMPKLLEVQSTKDFASTYLNDIFFRMAVNRVLDAAPETDAIPVNAEDLESAEMCLRVVEKFLNANQDYKIQYTKHLDGTILMKFIDLSERRTDA